MTSNHPVTEADRAVARAFGRPVPELTESIEPDPAAEMGALLEEFQELRMSRRGDSAEVARNAAIARRAMMSSPVMEGRRQAYKVDRLDRLAELRETVAQLRGEVPLSGASADPAPTGREVTAEEADAAVAAAFGRTTKGERK